MSLDVWYMSEKDNWETPGYLFRELDEEFHFTVDLCADDQNHKCDKYYTKENDGLKADLTGERVFCNPPYGRSETIKWVKKCAESGELCVMLLPARTDTAFFHDYIYEKAEIRFLRGRLHFESGGVPQDRAPFPSMIVIFRGLHGQLRDNTKA